MFNGPVDYHFHQTSHQGITHKCILKALSNLQWHIRRKNRIYVFNFIIKYLMVLRTNFSSCDIHYQWNSETLFWDKNIRTFLEICCKGILLGNLMTMLKASINNINMSSKNMGLVDINMIRMVTLPNFIGRDIIWLNGKLIRCRQGSELKNAKGWCWKW